MCSLIYVNINKGMGEISSDLTIYRNCSEQRKEGLLMLSEEDRTTGGWTESLSSALGFNGPL